MGAIQRLARLTNSNAPEHACLRTILQPSCVRVPAVPVPREVDRDLTRVVDDVADALMIIDTSRVPPDPEARS